MNENTEANTRPVTVWDKALAFLKKNLGYLGILVIVSLFLVLSLTTRGCGFTVSVPAEWMDDFSASYNPTQGNNSYSFFGNLIRGLTQEHLIDYNLDELQYTSADEYDAKRQEYLENDSNIEWDVVYPAYYLDTNSQYQATFKREGKPEELKRDFRESVERMEKYGLKSFTGLDVPNFGNTNPRLSVIFTDFFRFLQDSELMLNVTVPKSGKGVPYRLDARQLPRSLSLKLNGRHDKFNSDLKFARSRVNARRDVENGSAQMGFYLKYKPVKTKAGLKEIDLNIGKIYLLYSPNLNRSELQWIYNQYVSAAVDEMKQINPFIRPNRYWLPDQYPYVADEVKEALGQIDQLKQTNAKQPTQARRIKVYYDTNDMRKFVQLLQSKSSSGQVNLIPGAAISPDAFMKEASRLKEPVIYIYGVSLHSKYNLPVEVISRSFWYKANSGDLWSDVNQIIEHFGARIVTEGQIDPREYQQYADLENELCLGSKPGRKGGLQPLFTVPYALIYKEKAITSQAFNTTRGWLDLQTSSPTPQRR